MKIGVITFSNSKDNYGQLLQCYAMQEYLRKHGHNPFLIRYMDTPPVDTTGFKIHKLFHYLVRLPEYLKWYMNRRKEQQDSKAYESVSNFEKRDFNGFLSRYINCSPLYNEASIHANPPKADAYICGSDQIWGGEDAYYLSFAPDNALKIAYAPSLGGLSVFPTEKELRMRELIGRLDRVGMREQSGVETCKLLGRKDAIKVVDPTLLLDSKDYLNLASKKHNSARTAFIYLLGNPMEVETGVVYSTLEKFGYTPVYVASQGRNDDLPKMDMSIEEWIEIVSKADFVVTNSFHCTVFALQFHKPFIAIPLSKGYERMNTRIEELLNACGLTNHFTNDIHQIPHLINCDFSRFDHYKLEQQKLSEKFLNL